MPNTNKKTNYNFVNLNTKTTYTFLNSLLKVDDLINFTLTSKMQYACIMDTNVMYGVMPFYHACIKNNIKPVVGFELSNNLYHCLLIALNYQGYKNLIKICSFNALDTPFNLEDYLQDVAVVDYLENINCPHDFYYTINLKNKNYIAVQNAKYIDPKDASVLKLLDAILNAKTIDDNEELKEALINKEIGNENLISINEANALFNEVGLSNLSNLLDHINLEIKFNEKYLMQFDLPTGFDNSKQYLRYLAVNGLKKRFKTDQFTRTYIDRLKMELNVIDKLGFNDYFLVVNEYVSWCKKNNIAVGPGRGSAVGSLVSYALDITSIDPMQYGLYFERFLNEARTSMPDIDIDFSDTRRQEVIDHLFAYYNNSETNKYRTSYLITFQTIKLKTAIRDVGRVLCINPKVIDQFSKKISLRYDENNPEQEIKNCINEKQLQDYDLLFYYVLKIVGLFRQYSMHAAGVVLSNVNMYNVIPIQKGNNDLVLTQYPMEYLESLGLLKMDILGLNNLTMLQDMLNFIKKQTNDELNLDHIDLFDETVYKMLSNGDTFGIFQFESSGMTALLKRVKPTCIDDLAMVSAMFRPGPQAQIDEWIKRRNDPNSVHPIIPKLEGVLDSTSGLLVYQEQVMQIAQVVAGFSLSQADLLRRAISKKHANELIELKQSFLNGCKNNGVNEKDANKVYDYIFEFASYGFNKSHAVAYAYLSYWLGYIKSKYPIQFLEGYLCSKSFKDNQQLIIDFCLQNNINLYAPDILNSNLGFNIDLKNKNIYFGFDTIKGIGTSSSEKMQQLKQIAKDHVLNVNLCMLKSMQVASKKMMQTLILAGCYDTLQKDRNQLLKMVDVIDDISSVIKNNDDYDGLNNLLDAKLTLSNFKNLSDQELLNNEALLLGYNKISIQNINKQQTNKQTWLDKEIKEFNDVTLVSFTSKTTKAGQAYAALNLQLNNGDVLNATIPAWKYKKYLDNLSYFELNKKYLVTIKKSSNFLNIENIIKVE